MICFRPKSHREAQAENASLRAPGGSQDWFLLYAGGHVTIPFKGRACDLAEGWAMAQLPAANLRHTYGKYA